jgi:superfamily II DNA helicase RecQ
LGIKADFYNSDVEPLQRQRVHHRWVSGHIKVVVATNAFGLGQQACVHITPAREHRRMMLSAFGSRTGLCLYVNSLSRAGINKPDVRFVLHHTVPQGVESYYQEAGRCGRDGLKGYCALWYSPRDLARQSTRVWGKQDS